MERSLLIDGKKLINFLVSMAFDSSLRPCVINLLSTMSLLSFIGASRTMLFTIQPKFRIFRSKNHGNSNYQWLNEKSFGLPHGLGIGGTLEGFRLFINDSLEKCTARDMCPTFEEGKLIPSGEEFEIDALEVWGCGGVTRVDAALKAQENNRRVIAENIQKARKIDKAAFFDSSFDREFLLSNTFSHQKEKQERLEEC